MRGNLYAQDIRNIFDDLNDMIGYSIQNGELHEGNMQLILAGSAPLIYNDWIPYGTDDIDYVSCTSQWLSERLPVFGVNNRILAYGDCWTYNYEDRLQLMYENDYLVVYQMCLEDLIFMKLTRWGDNDIEDVAAILANESVSVDLDFLRYLIYNEEEARGAGMNDRRYNELLAAYDDFLSRLETGKWSV